MLSARLTVIFLLTLIVAFFSFQERSNFAITPTDGMHYYNTAQTGVYLKNYVNDGYFQTWGAQTKKLDSVEHGNRFSRHVYADFPPGQPTVTFLVFTAFGKELNEKNLIGFNRLIQLISGLALTLSFAILSQKFLPGLIGFVYPLIMSAFLFSQPSFNYWLDSVFQYQSLSTLYISLFILIWAVGQTKGRTFLGDMSLAALVMLGLITDAIFIFFSLAFICVLILNNFEKRLAITRGIGVILVAMFLATTFNVLYWYQNQFLDNVIPLLKYRLAISDAGSSELSVANFIKMYARQYSFEMLAALAIAPFAYCSLLLQKSENLQSKSLIRDMGLLLAAPVYVYVIVFPNAFSSHELFHIHFIFPIVFVLFALIPKLIEISASRIGGVFFHLPFLLAISCYVYNSAHSTFFQYPQLGVKEEKTALFIKQHTSFDDVVFSPNFRIAETPPQLQNLSDKLVYPIRSMKEIAVFEDCMRDTFPDKEYQIKLFFKGPHELRAAIKDIALDMEKVDDLEIYSIKTQKSRNRSNGDLNASYANDGGRSCGLLTEPIQGAGSLWTVWHPSLLAKLQNVQ